jgi:hypothetical protein
MDRTVKGTIAVIVSAFYLPMRKAQTFIAALQSLQSTPPTSLLDLENRIGTPLDYPSPIGQEELVRNTANSVLNFVQNGTDATTTAALIGFLNSYYKPILDQGRGMSFGQDVYLEGAVNEIAFAQTGDPSYLQDALKYYGLGHELGPNRPQPLYGLFDVYRAIGDATDTKIIASEILANWPADTRVQASLQQFLSSTPAISVSPAGNKAK